MNELQLTTNSPPKLGGESRYCEYRLRFFRTILAALCLSGLVAAGMAQVQETLPSPTPVPFTAEPRQLQWRMGFDLGNALILEMPELNPDNDSRLAMAEAERLLPRPSLAFGLALLPFSRVNVRNQQLVNPKQWTIVD